MAIKTGYDNGQFSWVDLVSHGMDGAKEFYGSVFGWTSADQETHGGPPYTIFNLEGRGACGLGEMNEAMKSQGVPPSWNSYVQVADCEATVQRARELGAQITIPTMQVLDSGWLSFFNDPTGGHVGIWQANQHFGSEVVNEPGSFCWNELVTRDVEKAREFYGALFGWEFREFEGSPSKYYIIQNNDSSNGGLMQMTEEWGDEIPPHWAVYFAVADVDTTVERIRQAGGRIHEEPFDTPVGRIAVCGDAQGAPFSVIRLEQE